MKANKKKVKREKIETENTELGAESASTRCPGVVLDWCWIVTEVQACAAMRWERMGSEANIGVRLLMKVASFMASWLQASIYWGKKW